MASATSHGRGVRAELARRAHGLRAALHASGALAQAAHRRSCCGTEGRRPSLLTDGQEPSARPKLAGTAGYGPNLVSTRARPAACTRLLHGRPAAPPCARPAGGPRTAGWRPFHRRHWVVPRFRSLWSTALSGRRIAPASAVSLSFSARPSPPPAPHRARGGVALLVVDHGGPAASATGLPPLTPGLTWGPRSGLGLPVRRLTRFLPTAPPPSRSPP